jgi:putative PIN family toxin of toxin-antitoxin system
MFKVVIDTNILIDAGGDNLSYTRKIIDEVIRGRIKAIASHKIWKEYQMILDELVNDPAHHELVNNFFSAVEIIEPKRKIDIVKYDREDNKFFEAALEGSAEYIITSDMHLFEVGEYRGIKAIKPKDFWLKYKKTVDKSGKDEWKSWMSNIIKE